MTVTNLEASAQFHYRECGEYALSFWASGNLDLMGIVSAARAQGDIDGERYLPHGRVQVSTAGKIRAAGYELSPDPPPGHYLLVLPDPPMKQDFDAIISAFDDPVLNPAGRMV